MATAVTAAAAKSTCTSPASTLPAPVEGATALTSTVSRNSRRLVGRLSPRRGTAAGHCLVLSGDGLAEAGVKGQVVGGADRSARGRGDVDQVPAERPGDAPAGIGVARVAVAVV